MKSNRLFWLLSGAPLFLVPFSGGCTVITENTPFLQAPTPIPTPTPVPAPKPPFFDPDAGLPRGTALNKAGDPVAPDAYRIAGTPTGDTVALQSINIVTAGSPPKEQVIVGGAETMKLAGIIAPTVEPSAQGAKSSILGFTRADDGTAQNLDVDQDPKFPTDLNRLKLVHVFFKGRKGPYEGKVLSLNRMLVRSGWAVVDLYSPTSFDNTQWLFDEAYARQHKLGMWGLGQTVQQRTLVKTNTAADRARRARNGRSSVQFTPSKNVNARAGGTLPPGGLQLGSGATAPTAGAIQNGVPPTGQAVNPGTVPPAGAPPANVPPANVPPAAQQQAGGSGQ